MKERRQAGVAIHVMLDWAGSAKMDGRLLDELTDAGIEVERYHPLRWYRSREAEPLDNSEAAP